MSQPVDPDTGEIDYDLAVTLDAEDLAELGVLTAYEALTPHLVALGVRPADVTHTIDPHIPEYSVECSGSSYLIQGPGLDADSAWGLATFALFDIVNRQLAGTDARFFAINGGNDLFGIFMTPQQAERACASLPRKQDWPYLPTSQPDWFGMEHD